MCARAYEFVWDGPNNEGNNYHSTLAVFLLWGWVFIKRTRILSGIQFTSHFIESVVVQTKWFVGSSVNIILTLQTCGRSSRAAESKRQALGNYFSQQICYMIPISKLEYRRDFDLGLHTFWVLAKKNRCAMVTYAIKTYFARRKNRNVAFRSCFFHELKKCTDPDLSLLYHLHLMLETYGRFARKNVFLALSVCFPQTCSRAGRRFAASRSHLHYYWQIISFPHQQIGLSAL